jgi:hypothetical protein
MVIFCVLKEAVETVASDCSALALVCTDERKRPLSGYEISQLKPDCSRNKV